MYCSNNRFHSFLAVHGRGLAYPAVFGRLLQVTVRPMLWERCPVCLSVTLVIVAKRLDDQGATWY